MFMKFFFQNKIGREIKFFVFFTLDIYSCKTRGVYIYFLMNGVCGRRFLNNTKPRESMSPKFLPTFFQPYL